MFWRFWRKYPQHAAEWVVRLSGSDVDRRSWQAFSRWLDGDPKRASEFKRHAQTWQAASHHAEKLSVLLAAADAPTATRKPRFSRATAQWMLPLGAAATIAAVMFFGDFLNTKSRFETHFAQTLRVVLDDQSVLHLNTESRVKVAFQKNRRRLQLQKGEAFFEVSRDPARPFEVLAGDIIVTAVGTQFSVDYAADGLRVDVVEGAVDVLADSSRGDRSLTMRVHAGYRFSFQPGDASAPTVSPVPVERIATWRDGRLIFDDTLVGNVIKKMNRYSSRKLIVRDSEILSRTLGGTFASDDVEAVAVALRDIYGFQLRNVGDDIEIERE